MLAHDFIAGTSVGLIGGFTSGLLGVSPGGGLVVFSVLLLGCEQHVAQGISLVAQIPPTSLSGIRRYWENGSRAPMRWLVLLILGMVVGGIAGALAITRLLTDFLFGVKPADAVTFAGVAILLGGVALLACYIPARRAARVDPLVALSNF